MKGRRGQSAHFPDPKETKEEVAVRRRRRQEMEADDSLWRALKEAAERQRSEKEPERNQQW